MQELRPLVGSARDIIGLRRSRLLNACLARHQPDYGSERRYQRRSAIG